jgi:hypothetical protein
MTDHTCAREHDVVAAVLSRRWHMADDDLKGHADVCESCREVVAVANLLSAEQDRARSEVHVPAAGQVWWRAAIRARLEAAHAAARPLTWLHGIAGACALGLAVAVAGMAWPTIRDIAVWLAEQVPGVDSGVGEVAVLMGAAVQKSLPLAFIVAAFVVLAPVALYFALSDDRGR